MAELNTISTLINDANLEAYYRFESGAETTDSSTNSNTLTAVNTPTYAVGKYGNGVDLEASSSQNMTVANDLGIAGNANISVALWFKLESTTGTQVLFQHSSTTGASKYLQAFNSGGTLFFDSAGGGGDSGNAVSAGVWYHIAFTRTAAGACVGYINGQAIADTPLTGAGVNGDHFNIGVDTSNYADGIIDDVAVFSKVLSSTEVLELYRDSSSKFFMVF